MNKFISTILVFLYVFFVGFVDFASAESVNFSDKLEGYILLQVESVGEAWYINPVDGKRYYMRDGAAAYDIMRYFGLGASNADIEKILDADKEMIARLMGRIVLQIEEHGEAYYIHPKDGSVHYLKNGEAAYELMRNLSLGITNHDLARISKGQSDIFIMHEEKVDSLFGVVETIRDSVVSPVSAEVGDYDYEEATLAVSDAEVVVGDVEDIVVDVVDDVEEVVDNVDIFDLDKSDELNEYWVGLVNEMRRGRGLSELVIGEDWVRTASEWSVYMAKIDLATHSRPDGASMHKWLDSKNVSVGERGGDDGWSRNYFTENVAWNVINSDSVENIKEAMDETFYWMMDEESYDGVHYRTMIHTDWNSVGVGYVVNRFPNGRYQIYLAMHYGNLKLTE